MNIMFVLMTIGAFVMAVIAMIVRMKAIKKPATEKKIILPPLFMSTGFLMFLYEPTHISAIQFFEAFSVGLLFSVLLIKTSQFEVKESDIYMKRSKAFVFLLFGLLIARVVFKIIIGDSINIEELAAMFFILAYGMIIPWRIYMLIAFRKMKKQMDVQHNTTAAVRS
ncbi:Membrane protein CcdC involved in cytochrome C biogenesis [Alteribacillus persepolensis]|uniref:Membrane protein CcdC involved in cytochrome C biogenesis n=1 Tax=Alteribacillus persepolensis TaxID=568899 RepID=A0A1G7YXB4_9BACI|nr:cytochrome c biogenesis protein CcdC [Alteribacillus persepolensis]SDH01101.1 Membrane protein CcdC involved in cytochrome C biogenesis [Alteribacillus persepolensis]